MFGSLQSADVSDDDDDDDDSSNVKNQLNFRKFQ